jgi:hypothetical protein
MVVVHEYSARFYVSISKMLCGCMHRNAAIHPWPSSNFYQLHSPQIMDAGVNDSIYTISHNDNEEGYNNCCGLYPPSGEQGALVS